MPIILYAFGCQIQIFDIFDSVFIQNQNDPSNPNPNSVQREIKRMNAFQPVLHSSVCMMVLLFSLTGIFGSYAFSGSIISGDVLVELSAKGLFGKIARVVLVMACIFSAPLIVHPTRHCLLSFLEIFLGSNPIQTQNENQNENDENQNENENEKGEDCFYGRMFCCCSRRFVVTCLVVLTSSMFAVSGIPFLVVVGALGAFLCSPLFFLLPGLLLLLTLTQFKKKRMRNKRNEVNVNNHHKNEMEEEVEDGLTDVLIVDSVDSDGSDDSDDISVVEGWMWVMGCGLVCVGVLTFVLSVWAFLLNE